MSDSRLFRTVASGIIAIAAGIALSACGSSGNGEVVDLGTGNAPTADAPANGGSEEQAPVVAVSGYEYGYFLVAPALPGSYTFEFTNDGAMDHDLVIEGEGINEATPVIGPGETETLTVDLTPGTYTVYCSVGDHRAQGMEFTFTVTE